MKTELMSGGRECRGSPHAERRGSEEEWAGWAAVAETSDFADGDVGNERVEAVEAAECKRGGTESSTGS